MSESSNDIDALLRPETGAELNTIIISGLLYGIYTTIFVQAIWRLLAKKNKGVYTLALIVLWLAETTMFALNWMEAYNAFVVDNTSPVTIFISFSTVSPFQGIPGLVEALVADGILIWRCHVLWNGNKWILSILSAMLLAAAGTKVGTLALANTATPQSSVSAISRVLVLDGVMMIISVATTVSATSLIVLRIILVTRRSRVGHSYRKIIEIAIESAALYSVITVITGIIALILPIIPDNNQLDVTTLYITIIQGIMTGLAPTMIAFRVAEEESPTVIQGTNPVLSRLTFRRSAPGTQSDYISTHISTVQFERRRSIATTRSSIDTEAQATHGDLQKMQDDEKKVIQIVGPNDV